MMIVFVFACLHVVSSLPNLPLKTVIMPSARDVESAENDNGDDAGLGLGAKITVERKSCSPNSYMIKDCNVCKCNALGVEERCTQNDCASLAQRSLTRRNYGNLPPAATATARTCVPQNWYALGPCQFCYCQQSSKLVCTTRASGHKLLTHGTYNLTDCGQGLIKELYDLGVSPPSISRTNAEKNDGHAAPARLPPAQARNAPSALNSPDEPAYLPKVPAYLSGFALNYPPMHVRQPGDVSVSPMMSKSAEKNSNSPLRASVSSKASVQMQKHYAPFKVPDESEYEDDPAALLHELNPFGHEEVSFQMVGRPSALPGQANQELMLITEQKLPAVNEIMMAQGMPKEMAEMLALMPAASQNLHMKWEQKEKIGQEAEADETENPQFLKYMEMMPEKELMMRLSLPPSLKRIIGLALRKSMVKIDASQTCVPGTTTKDGCNYCYCLNNGKMLCTDKKTC